MSAVQNIVVRHYHMRPAADKEVLPRVEKLDRHGPIKPYHIAKLVLLNDLGNVGRWRARSGAGDLFHSIEVLVKAEKGLKPQHRV